MQATNVQSDLPSLAVDEGQTVTLTTKRPELTGFRVVRIRPRTPAALMLVGGAQLIRPPRLSDPQAFEEVQESRDLVDLRVIDSSGRVGNHSINFIKNVIRKLEPERAIPANMTFEVPRRRQLAERSLKQGESPREASTVTLSVPNFISSYNVVFVGLRFSNILLGPNATLIIDEDVSHLQVFNFMAYSSAKVVQKTPYLTVDVLGTMVGNIFITAKDTGVVELIAKIPAKPVGPKELLAIGIKPMDSLGL